MVLQLHRLNLDAQARLTGAANAFPHDDDALERHIDETVKELRQTRRTLARRRGGLWRVQESLDRRLRTERVEYLDRDDYPEESRRAEMRALDRYNQLLFNYHRMERIVVPELLAIARREGRPARFLELAGGAGAFSLRLAERVKREGLPIEVTGSDIQPGLIEVAQHDARRRGVPARFEVLNAFATGLDDRAQDLAFIAQSLHHLSPGQLGRAVREATRVAGDGLVALDGRRSLFLLGFLAASWAPTLNACYVHDAVVTARKFYSEPELRLIAELAAPSATVTVRRAEPGYSVVRVRP